MLNALCVIAGIIVGAVASLLIARKKQSSLAARIQGAEQRAITAEATLSERQKQYDETREKADQLQASLSTETQARVKAETEKAEAFQRLEEGKKILAEAEKKLTDTFKALASTTLDSNTQAFLNLVKGTFEKLMAEAKGDIGKREEAIKGLVTPLAELLQKFETHVQGLEKSRQEAYASLDTQLKSIAETHGKLQKETTCLVTALKTPQVRGRWCGRDQTGQRNQNHGPCRRWRSSSRRQRNPC
jgi:DNA recombination protein RmuC